MGGRRGVDPPVKLPNNLLQQTAASLSGSQSILPSRPPLLSFGVRRLGPPCHLRNAGESVRVIDQLLLLFARSLFSQFNALNSLELIPIHASGSCPRSFRVGLGFEAGLDRDPSP